MTNTDKTQMDETRTKAAVEAAIEQGDDIRNKVRNIVVDSLKEGHLDTDSLKQLIQTVIEAANETSPKNAKQTVETLQQIVNGLDDALAKAAEASKLAIEEAVGHVDDFSETDVKRAMSDLEGLEDLFIDTMNEFADAGQDAAHQVVSDLASHARNSGTAVGRTVAETLAGLQYRISHSPKPKLEDVTNTLRAGGATIASIASGILAGLADSLQPEKSKSGKTDQESGKDDD